MDLLGRWPPAEFAVYRSADGVLLVRYDNVVTLPSLLGAAAWAVAHYVALSRSGSADDLHSAATRWEWADVGRAISVALNSAVTGSTWAEMRAWGEAVLSGFPLVLLYVGLSVVFVGPLVHQLVGGCDLVIGIDRLAVVHRGVFSRRAWTASRAEVRAVTQVKDCGDDDDDDGPSGWGLLLDVGGEERSLLRREPIEVSDWLGPVLARWAGVPFVPATRRR